MARGADDEKMTIGMEVEIVDYDDFCTLWLKHLPSGMTMPYGRSWKRISTAKKHANIIKEYYEKKGIPVAIVKRLSFRHPKLSFGDIWSDKSPNEDIDSEGNNLGRAMQYRSDIGEVLITPIIIDFTPECFSLELSFEIIHHILNMDFGKQVSDQFEFCEEPVGVHLFGPEILETFGLYEEGRALGEGPCGE